MCIDCCRTVTNSSSGMYVNRKKLAHILSCTKPRILFLFNSLGEFDSMKWTHFAFQVIEMEITPRFCQINLSLEFVIQLFLPPMRWQQHQQTETASINLRVGCIALFLWLLSFFPFNLLLTTRYIHQNATKLLQCVMTFNQISLNDVQWLAQNVWDCVSN